MRRSIFILILIMDKQKISELAGKFARNGKGAGMGAGVMALVGAALYGGYQSFFTGYNLEYIKL